MAARYDCEETIANIPPFSRNIVGEGVIHLGATIEFIFAYCFSICRGALLANVQQ